MEILNKRFTITDTTLIDNVSRLFLELTLSLIRFIQSSTLLYNIILSTQRHADRIIDFSSREKVERERKKSSMIEVSHDIIQWSVSSLPLEFVCYSVSDAPVICSIRMRKNIKT